MSDIKVLEQRALEIRRKYDALNRGREAAEWDAKQLAQNFKKDVSELVAIIENRDIDNKKLRHELADCLWSVLVIARKLNIDIERAFWTTMEELDQRFKEGRA
ncbi:MAG TPA: MazG nucleotide pyrophosphohydrolase domain-containing protein [Candidatus Saccharimonadales bacterium]|nr:MazG nucleotide pyrophosphohydrolase domain-containing protein [Candidatus Saccharimonadales bacterium]